MLLLERRNTVVALLTSSFGYQTPQGSECLTFSQALEVLQRQCPISFQRAVRQSRKFLYRGESVTCPTILSPPSDLLDPRTYDDGGDAVLLFTCLENNKFHDLHSIRPSNGHIGTASRRDAAQWGAPCSIWPLGQPFAYMWPSETQLFSPGSSCDSVFVVGTGLDEALRLEKEIMYTSPSFLVMPETYEKDLQSVIF